MRLPAVPDGKSRDVAARVQPKHTASERRATCPTIVPHERIDGALHLVLLGLVDVDQNHAEATARIDPPVILDVERDEYQAFPQTIVGDAEIVGLSHGQIGRCVDSQAMLRSQMVDEIFRHVLICEQMQLLRLTADSAPRLPGNEELERRSGT